MINSILVFLAYVQLVSGVSAATVRDLRCEHLKDPLGIDMPQPVLGWTAESGKRGDVQPAYQVLVASTPALLAAAKGDLWDSGKVASDMSAQVEYAGNNALGVMLGNGFYCTQTPDCFQLDKAPWRTPPRMRFNLLVGFDDGNTTTVVSDGQWKQSTGEIVYNCVRGGETIDARRNPGKWLEAGYDDSAWKPALEVTAPLGKLAAEAIPPIRITDEYKAQKITEPKPGVYVVDFGRNLPGWLRWTATGKAGQTVALDFNEFLREDGTVDTQAQTSHTYGRYQHQECILSGAPNEVFEPRFTYHAFRFVEFRGLDKLPALEDVVAVRLHTQVPWTSSFETSEPQLNLLHNASRRTLEDCTWGGPTAEPVREKVIWLGDNVFEIDAYFYLFDCSLLYRKQTYDLMDAQEPNGHFGPVVPNGGWGEQGDGPVSSLHFCDSPWWSLALALGVNRLGTDYGDRRTCRISYDACRRYTDWQTGTLDNGLMNWGLWDWNPRRGSIETKGDYTSNVGYYYQAMLVAAQADALGKKEDAAKYRAAAEAVKSAFTRKFYDAANARYAPGSQTAQSLPLIHDMVPTADRKRVLNTLLETVKGSGNKLTAGFVGTMPILYMLNDAGYGDLVYEMIKDGWFPMLNNGDATTLGESPYAECISPVTGSGHHQFSACVAGWMYRCVAGIRPDLTGPGYQKPIIRPTLLSKLDWVKAHYDSVYGRIESNWKREGDQVTMEVTIPANTSATVYVPAKDASGVTEGGKLAAQAEGVRFLRMQDAAAVYEVGAGHYQFASTKTTDGTATP